ncbi:MAG TPA: hypothetical protein VMB71_01620 [Acetobacteraceae bacterium]|nr:hypothetical protein [Acetobacteraceae bacterium]
MLKRSIAVAALLLGLPCAALADQSAAYCTSTGGAVQTRIPTYGTNGGTSLPLAHPKQFCEYTSKDGTTHIDLLLSTLFTKQPTLAALAYYAEVPFNGSGCEGSPGSCYCSQIGGTDLFGGINAAGGGWVLSTDNTNVLDACIFPDLSSIDTYGLFYHSAGIIRGRNLKKLLRYKNPY